MDCCPSITSGDRFISETRDRHVRWVVKNSVSLLTCTKIQHSSYHGRSEKGMEGAPNDGKLLLVNYSKYLFDVITGLLSNPKKRKKKMEN